VDIGLWRGAGGFIAEHLNRQTGESKYDYLDFYMGTIWVSQRVDLTPIHELIFKRLKKRFFSWCYRLPEMDFPSDKPDGARTLRIDKMKAELKKIRGETIEDAKQPPVPEIVVTGVRPTDPAGGIEYGQSSWYQCAGDFAAHLQIPKGTVVIVTNLDNGRKVTVIIDDRGPYGVPGRIIDLCATAFAQIAPLAQGVANVEISW